MLIKDIVNTINKILANSSSFKLTYKQLEFYINSAVDYINSELKLNYPTPQEYWEWDILGNNILYNTSITGYNYLGQYKEAPVGPDPDDTYFNITESKYYTYKSISIDEGEYIYDWVIINLDFENNQFSHSMYNGTNLTIVTVPVTLDLLDVFDYDIIPVPLLRSVLIYYAAASYLEEEDEFESQYKMYMARTEDNLIRYRRLVYSTYDLNEYQDPEEPEPQNPYWLGDDDV